MQAIMDVTPERSLFAHSRDAMDILDTPAKESTVDEDMDTVATKDTDVFVDDLVIVVNVQKHVLVYVNVTNMDMDVKSTDTVVKSDAGKRIQNYHMF